MIETEVSITYTANKSISTLNGNQKINEDAIKLSSEFKIDICKLGFFSVLCWICWLCWCVFFEVYFRFQLAFFALAFYRPRYFCISICRWAIVLTLLVPKEWISQRFWLTISSGIRPMSPVLSAMFENVFCIFFLSFFIL